MAKEKVVVPTVGESIQEVSVAKLLKDEGSFVQDGEGIIEIESDKASMEVPAVASGKITFKVKVGDSLPIGALLAEIDTSVKGEVKAKEPVKELPKEEKKEPPIETPKPVSGSLRSSPDEFLAEIKKPQETKPVEKPSQPVEATSEQERKPMSKLRKTIARRLVQVKNETAMLTTFNEVDMSEVMRLRNQEKEFFQKKHNLKLTFMPFFVKAVVSALEEFPEVNAYIDGDDIVYNRGCHIGIAVSTPTGLVVPIIRNAEKMNFVEITKTMQDLAEKARDRKLSVADMSNGTFTITNGGVFGSMLSTPILNPPQSAILGMHNIVERPVAIQGKVEIRPIMYLALSYDHRIVDGKESVSFLVHVKNMLEDPAKFIFGG